MTVALELATYLASQGVGTLDDTLFVGREPDAPDTAMAVLEYPGGPLDYTHDLTIRYEHPRLQLWSRSVLYSEARANAEAMYGALLLVVNQALSGVRYLRVTPLQPPFVLQRDANERTVCIFNAECFKEVGI